MEAVVTIESEVRELIRRTGIDPVSEPGKVNELLPDAVQDYDERSIHGGLPLVGNIEQAVKAVMDAVAGFGPLQQYFDDPTVEEIWINAPCRVVNCIFRYPPLPSPARRRRATVVWGTSSGESITMRP